METTCVVRGRPETLLCGGLGGKKLAAADASSRLSACRRLISGEPIRPGDMASHHGPPLWMASLHRDLAAAVHSVHEALTGSCAELASVFLLHTALQPPELFS